MTHLVVVADATHETPPLPGEGPRNQRPIKGRFVALVSEAMTALNFG